MLPEVNNQNPQAQATQQPKVMTPEEVTKIVTEKVSDALNIQKSQYQSQLDQAAALSKSVEEIKKQNEELQKFKNEVEEKKKLEEAALAEAAKKEEDTKLTLTQRVEKMQKATEEILTTSQQATEARLKEMADQLKLEKLNNLKLKTSMEFKEKLPEYMMPNISIEDTEETYLKKVEDQTALYNKILEDAKAKFIPQTPPPTNPILNGTSGTITNGTSNLTSQPQRTWAEIKNTSATDLQRIKEEAFKKYGLL